MAYCTLQASSQNKVVSKVAVARIHITCPWTTSRRVEANENNFIKKVGRATAFRCIFFKQTSAEISEERLADNDMDLTPRGVGSVAKTCNLCIMRYTLHKGKR